MKKYVLIVCMFALAALLVTAFRTETDRFLGLPCMSRDEYDALREDRKEYALFDMPDLQLVFGDTEIPYACEEGCYYLPLAPDEPEWEQESIRSLAEDLGGTLSVLMEPGDAPDKQESIRESEVYRLIYADREGYCEYSLIFTGFPMVMITTADGLAVSEDPVNEREKLVDFRMYISGKARQYDSYILDSAAYLKLRGNASAYLDKKSFKLSLVRRENLAQNNQLNILNIRTDDDWIFYGMYAEGTKARDKLAAELWNSFGRFTEFGTDYGYTMEYTETIINGRYWGLYGIMPRVDAKQLGLCYEEEGARDILYKTNVPVKPSLELLEQAKLEGETELREVEIQFPKHAADEMLWNPLLRLLALMELRNAEQLYEEMDTENLVDYWIYLQLLYAEDNSWKNQFLVAKDMGESYRFLIVPWDLDYSFGLVYDEEQDGAKSYGYDVEYILPNPVMDILLEENNTKNIAGRIRERWQALRMDVLREERILSELEEITQELERSGALNRERERWPEGLYEEDASGIEDYLKDRLQFLDIYMEGLEERYTSENGE